MPIQIKDNETGSRDFLSRKSLAPEKQILHNSPFPANNTIGNAAQGEERNMKATGIVRRVDDLGRIVIPKEIRRTLRIREGNLLMKTLTPSDRYLWAMRQLTKRYQ